MEVCVPGIRDPVKNVRIDSDTVGIANAELLKDGYVMNSAFSRNGTRDVPPLRAGKLKMGQLTFETMSGSLVSFGLSWNESANASTEFVPIREPRMHTVLGDRTAHCFEKCECPSSLRRRLSS